MRQLWACGFCASYLIVCGAAFGEGTTQPAVSGYVQQAVEDFDLTPQLLSGVRAKGAGGGGGDPLKAMAEQMSIIRDDLGEYQTDAPVQTKEKKVITDLDALIAALERHTGTGQGNIPNGGRRQSIIVTADPKNGPLHDVNDQGRQWGQLPPKQREEILQSRTEGFPPGYEALLQNYFQQLSQEKGTDDRTSSTAAPATAPAAP
ncbi:MAG TPA: hypothetical protein VM008_04650 [Phycisphaerae bacterium]|nr:hypothetical protein [Phycisphaerae bacterium]